jgi:CubicO group peptidase (beta-lactamase class C family)
MKSSRKKILIIKSVLSVFLLTAVIIILSQLAGCCSLFLNPDKIKYTPVPGQDWEVSTPAEQGLDPMVVAELYCNAEKLKTLYGLVVIKNGYLIAEGYFNGSSVEQKIRTQSATKSFTSALVGIALDQGHLTSLDQKLVDFFPEIADQVTDPRKNLITIRDLLQMRAGYPWEESHPALWDGLLSGHYVSLIEGFPLIADPGTEFHYSNLTSNWLGIIVDRASGMNLKSYAEENLFLPMGIEAGEWGQDAEGHNNGCGDLHLRARDMARFGQLFLDDGVYKGNRIISADWVHQSLKTYSEDAADYRVGRNFKDIGYGYQWWSARSGDYNYNLAWGHGGQLIVLVDELEMVLVVAADPFYLVHTGESWKNEKANVNLIGTFIRSIPKPQ